jgi:hypothetical protein
MTAFRSLWCALSLALFALLPACGDEPGANGSAVCAIGQTSCEAGCVDTQIDLANCGGCNLVCPAAATCSTGACHDANGAIVPAIVAAPTSCPTGQLLCDAMCIDPASTDEHCGACGVVCGAGQVCDLGACREIGLGCPAGRTLCGDECVDLTSDAAHCGSCDGSCGSGTCVAGACSCRLPEALCKLGCTNVQIDAENCGTCGNTCGEGQACTAGSCQCAAGNMLCATGCADLTSDAANCGTCGNACSGGEVCANSACACPTGLDSCDGECVDLGTTLEHCGTCGTLCENGNVCLDGLCACAEGTTACGDACSDLETDAANCGACGTACSSDQVCTAGECVCPEGTTSCDGTCVDTTSSAEHCGECGAACFEGQVCNASACECAEGFSACAETCVDFLADDANCGECGNACVGGETCQEGSCACPEGQSLCSDLCIDTQTDAMNCGGCDIVCGLGELCNDAMCQGGGLGDDGCQGVAENLILSKLSFYQTVEIPIMVQGDEAERNVEVLAGRDTLVRAFVETGNDWSPRDLSARLYLDDGEERFTVYTSEPQNISGSSEDEERDSTFEFRLTGDQLRTSTRYAVEIVECGEAPGQTALSARYPAQDGIELGAMPTGGLRIHLVPLQANGRAPNTSDQILEDFRAGFLATYPIDSVEFTISEVYEVYSAEDWTYNLEALRSLRSYENPDAGVYYYGLIRPTETIREFCGYGCTAGIGYVPTGGGPYAATGRVSMGLAYDDEESIRTMLHEVGHNHGRNHAPCVPPGSYIAGVDPYFPHDNAALGVFGYDIRNDRLFTPDHPDIMAYCEDPWLSDYTYVGLLDTIRDVNEIQARLIPDPSRRGDFQALLVDDARGPRWMPARYGVYADGAPVTAEVLDATGAVLDSIQVYKNVMADVSAYSLDVPVPESGWASIRVDGLGVVAF